MNYGPNFNGWINFVYQAKNHLIDQLLEDNFPTL